MIDEKDIRIETDEGHGVKVTHLPTGIVVEVKEYKQRPKNESVALKQLTARLHTDKHLEFQKGTRYRVRYYEAKKPWEKKSWRRGKRSMSGVFARPADEGWLFIHENPGPLQGHSLVVPYDGLIEVEALPPKTNRRVGE